MQAPTITIKPAFTQYNVEVGDAIGADVTIFQDGTLSVGRIYVPANKSSTHPTNGAYGLMTRDKVEKLEEMSALLQAVIKLAKPEPTSEQSS